ncbi:MAG: trigger factor [Chloroflexota bacterium]
MKVTSDKVENSQAYLTVEMEPAEVDASLQKSYSRLVKKTKIPGFRVGKAPRAVLERYVGKENLLEDALKELIPEAYKKALAEKEIEAFADPSIEVAQTEPVVFKAVVPLKPTATLGDYRSIRMTPEPVTVTEETMNATIEQLRHQHATWEPVTRDVQTNDLVVLDIDSKIDGQSYIKRQGAQYQVLTDLPLPMPGFAAELVGMKQDEEKEFKLKFPEDYPRPELVGKEPEFKVRVSEIKQEKLPELNDDFAQEVNPEFKKWDELKEKVKEDLLAQLEGKSSVEFEGKVIDAAAETATVEFPPIMVDYEIDQLIRNAMQQWQINSFEEYLKNINKTEEDLRTELMPMAVKRVTQSLVLGKVAEEEKLTVSEDELNTEIENIVQRAAEDKRETVRKNLDNKEVKASIENMLLTRKTVARLLEIAKNEDKEVQTEPTEQKEEQKEEQK